MIVAPLAYGALATAAALAVPEFVDANALASPRGIGVLVGLLVFAIGLLLHEIVWRSADVGAAEDRITSLAAHIARLREETRQMRETQRLQLAATPEGGNELETVVAEMRMLKTLVSQLSTRREQPVPARMAAGGAPAAQRTLTADGSEPAFRAPAAARAGGGGGQHGTFTADGWVEYLPEDPDDMLIDVVRDALANDRIDLYVQPIVTLPQRNVDYYEAFVQIRAADGTIIPPEQYQPIAERAGLVTAIDNMMLVRCVQHVRRMRRRRQPVTFFCNIAGETLADREFFGDFIAFMRENTDLTNHLMFEISQYDFYHLDPRTERELESLAKLGFRFSLDQTTNLDLFVTDLSAKGFRFVKVEAATLLAKLSRQGDPRALKRALDRGAIDLVVYGIDNDGALLDTLDYAIDFGQGRLFGLPQPADLR